VRAPRIAVLGGGSGLSTLLAGLKRITDNITAVVTMTDDGGSSGRLVRSLGGLPPGDLRNCLVALAEDDALLSRLFQHRFSLSNGRRQAPSGLVEPGGRRDPLDGHAFGNLFLTALASVAGGFDRATAAASHVLNIRGRVLPASLESARLTARLVNGRRVTGETRISKSAVRIDRVRLVPSSPAAGPGVHKALLEAELVILGPGSLYTSVIPPLLVRGVAETLARSRARRVYVCNLMTQPGETGGFDALDHLDALIDHLKTRVGDRKVLDAMLVNDAVFPAALLRRYAAARAYPVAAPPVDHHRGVRILRASFKPVPSDRPAESFRVRHSPERLTQVLTRLFLRAA